MLYAQVAYGNRLRFPELNHTKFDTTYVPQSSDTQETIGYWDLLLINQCKRCSSITLYAVLFLISNIFLSVTHTILWPIEALLCKVPNELIEKEWQTTCYCKYFPLKKRFSPKLLFVHGNWKVNLSTELFLFLLFFANNGSCKYLTTFKELISPLTVHKFPSVLEE